MTTRRGFLGAILAAGVAPAFVGSKILMPVRAIAPWEPWRHIERTGPVPDWPSSMQRQALEYEAPRYRETFLLTTGLTRRLGVGDRITIAGMPRAFVVTAVMGSDIVGVAAA